MVHAAEFAAGTLCHAPAAIAAPPFDGTLHALFTLCDECAPACAHLVLHLAQPSRYADVT
jgi:hypothetical protein